MPQHVMISIAGREGGGINTIAIRHDMNTITSGRRYRGAAAVPKTSSPEIWHDTSSTSQMMIPRPIIRNTSSIHSHVIMGKCSSNYSASGHQLVAASRTQNKLQT